jgi:protein-disulfide isomerase
MSRQERRGPARPPKPSAITSRTLLIVAVVAVAGALAVAALHYATTRPSGEPAARPAAREPGGTTRGPAGAPVTVEVFSDFLCGHCADFAQETEPALIAEFVEPGVVRLVYRQFAFLGPLSEAAAIASECAADQQRFWAYHDALFALTSRRALRESRDLEIVARELGLDMQQFGTCRTGSAARNRAAADKADGVGRGVEGTPTLFINKQVVVGAQPIDVLRPIINSKRPR